jgi:hypothetical protein
MGITSVYFPQELFWNYSPATLAKQITPWLTACEQFELRLTLESGPVFSTPREAANFCRQIAHPLLGWCCLDSTLSPIDNELSACLPWLAEVHLRCASLDEISLPSFGQSSVPDNLCLTLHH